MHYKQYLHFIIALIIVSISFSIDKSCNSILQKQLSSEDQSFGIFNVNRITTHFSNDCMLASHIATGSSGMLFDGNSINYCSGIWIADSSNGNIRIAAAEFASEFTPGSFGAVYDSTSHDIIPNNIMGDQSHWYVCNDGGSHNVFATDPLNIEMESTIWGYANNHENMMLQNVMFVKCNVVNKGNSDIENSYIGIWADSDLGYAGDDFVGCDTSLNLAYSYNEGEDNLFGEKPPAIGIVVLKGPIEKSLGKTLENESYLRMTSFYKYT